jgi:hypothetical protein
METATTTDEGVALPLVFGAVAVLAAVGLTVFGFTGDQVAAGFAFALAMLAGSLSVAAYHVYP